MSENQSAKLGMLSLIEESPIVGALINMTYTNATVTSDDYKIQKVGGVPRNCFLLAVPRGVQEGLVPDEAILLSVQDVADLTSTRDLRSIREDFAQRGKIADVNTREKLQVLGFECRIMGSFYEGEHGELLFGADVDRVLAYSSYEVLRPRGSSLSVIASYCRPRYDDDTPQVVEVGHVRYSETQRTPDPDAKVYLDVRDFVGKKTAVLGMSRSGKALPEDARIPVPVSDKFPTGWALNGELEVGDEVLSHEFLPVSILSFSSWSEETTYKLTLQDGRSIHSSGGHLWRALRLDAPKAQQRSLLSEEDIARCQFLASETSADIYLPLKDIAKLAGVSPEVLFNITQISGLYRHLAALPPEAFANTADETFDEDDSEEDAVEKHYRILYPLAETLNLLVHYGQNPAHKWQHIMTTQELVDALNRGEKWALPPLVPAKGNEEQDLPLPPYEFGQKVAEEHPEVGVPPLYLRASLPQRLQVLQGLMDSPLGEVRAEQGTLYLETPNRALRNSVLELVRSLGAMAVAENRGVAFTLTLPAFQDKQKKKTQFQLIQEKKMVQRPCRIESIVADSQQRVRCLTVNTPEALHLAGDYIITHNSNTIKILVEQVFQYSKQVDKRIGQLIFDPQGEYSNANKQDSGAGSDPYALANIGTAHDVTIYRMRLKKAGESAGNEKLLLLNFLDEKNTELVWELMLAELNNSLSGNANYVSGLKNVSFEEPNEDMLEDKGKIHQLRIHHDRNRLSLYALMKLSRIQGNLKGRPLIINIGKDNRREVLELANTDGEKNLAPTVKEGEVRVLTVDGAHTLFQWVLEEERATYSKRDEEEVLEGGLLDMPETPAEARAVSVLSDSWLKDLREGDLKEFKRQFDEYEKGRLGVMSAFNRIKELHSPDTEGDVRQSVWDDLAKGRIVMVDLSYGSSTVTTILSELIVKGLMDRASDRFTSGEEPMDFQIVVEEAHNLFRREGAKDDVDPWVRLSKEAAKYNIGLLYATQEVSSVDSKILSNTSNWCIGHLNSKTETKVLSAYYGFSDWEEHLRATESKGFLRMKTESCPYIVPVQVNKFAPKEK